MTFTIEPRGPFSLEEANNFGFGQRSATTWDGIMRLAFCVDGYRDQVGVAVRQDDHGVHCSVEGSADLVTVRRQVARVLSLDHDGEAFVEVGERDPVMAMLQAAAPGLRPPLFYSPYEAAAWCIISARRPAHQMAEVRRQLNEAHGSTFRVAGEMVAALPTPERLLDLDSFPGLSTDKIDRLHGLATAALAGKLDVARIQGLAPGEAMADLQALKGIGPFYSSLIVVRSAGLADVAVFEPKAMALAARLWDLPGVPTEDEFSAMAERWRPFRTWAVVLIRAAATRVLPAG
ncbi:MAG: DNA-3-methyladenine glycosylase family protein [Acidimicrobiales bacterium]